MNEKHFSIRKKLLILIGIVCCISCGPSQKEFDGVTKEKQELQRQLESLAQQKEALEKELEGYRNTPEKLYANADELFKDKDVTNLQLIKDKLQKYHPESKEAFKVRGMVEKLEKEQRDKEERERAALEAKKKKEEAARLAAVKKLRKKYDDVSGITWYYNPYFTHYTNYFRTSVYMGKRESSKPWLCLFMSYCGDNWIFFEDAYLSYDGNTKKIPFDRYEDKKSDNDGGEVWEWIVITVDDELLSFLRGMVEGKSPKMRFSGKYTKTRNLSQNEIKGIRDVLLAYDVLDNE